MDDRPVRRGVPQLGQAVADLQDVVRLGQVEDLGRELEPDVRAGPGPCQPVHLPGRVQDHAVHLGPVAAQDHLAPDGGGRDVEVDDDPVQARHRLEGPLDQVGLGGGEDDHGDVVGDGPARRQVAYEVEVGAARGRVADLDLLEAHRDQQVEHPPLARGVHRFRQRLVAVPQVHRHPQRGPFDTGLRPAPRGQRDRDAVVRGAVAVRGHGAGALGVPAGRGLGDRAAGVQMVGKPCIGDRASDVAADMNSGMNGVSSRIAGCDRHSTAPRGGVPIASGPAAAAEKEETAVRHGRYSNQNATPQTT